jgi:hypothetical protein
MSLSLITMLERTACLSDTPEKTPLLLKVLSKKGAFLFSRGWKKPRQLQHNSTLHFYSLAETR